MNIFRRVAVKSLLKNRTRTIVTIIGVILSVILIGALLNLILWVICVIFSIIGGLAANKGEYYRYPFAVRLIK